MKSRNELKKYCPKCKTRKLKAEFCTDKHQYGGGLAGWCRDCIGKRVSHRRATQTSNGLCIEGRCENKTEPGRIRCKEHLLQNRIAALVQKGLREDEAEKVREALHAFNGVCPICSKIITYDKWHIDHSHDTGAFRGILCGPCNRMIGISGEDADTLQRAAVYLQMGK